MKLKMDINRGRTAADIQIVEIEPMYAGSMYVHKLLVEANLHDDEVLLAEFKVDGERFAQTQLILKERVSVQFALYEALIPSRLFKTEATKRVDVVIGLFRTVNGNLTSVLAAQPQSFTIQGDGRIFESQMSDEEREMYNESLIELIAAVNSINKNNITIKWGVDVTKDGNISNSVLSNVNIGDIYVNIQTQDVYVCNQKTDTYTTWQRKFNVRGAKGDKGDTGSTGATGQKGAQGIQGPKGDQGPVGPQGPKGEGYSIFKTYSSISAMNADAANVPEGKFVLISSNTNDEDNAKEYVKNSETV